MEKTMITDFNIQLDELGQENMQLQHDDTMAEPAP